MGTTGANLEFHAHVLATCSTGNMRSLNSLEVKAKVEPILPGITHDMLRLCNITVEFGDNSNPDYSQWKWTGMSQTKEHEHDLSGLSKWAKLRPTKKNSL